MFWIKEYYLTLTEKVFTAFVFAGRNYYLGGIQFSIFLLGETDFPASENHFFSIFRHSNQWFFHLVEKYFWTKSFIPACGNGFWLVETVLFCSEVFPYGGNRHSKSILSTGNSIILFQFFFCQSKLLLKLGASQFLKTSHILASGPQVSRFFQRFFFEVKKLSRRVERYFSISIFLNHLILV